MRHARSDHAMVHCICLYRSYRRSAARSRKRRRSGSHYSAWRLRPSHRMACRHAENLTDDIGDYFKLSGNMGYHSACIYHLLYIHNP